MASWGGWISVYELHALAELIRKNIRKDFETLHLSTNLMNTIQVSSNSENEVDVKIPAMKYNISLFLKKKIIVYTFNGSYAQEVDATGGWSKKHTDYVERAILSAVREWLETMMLKGRIEWK